MELSLVVEEKSISLLLLRFCSLLPLESGILFVLYLGLSQFCVLLILGVGETSWRVVDVHEFSATSLDNV